MQRQLTRLYNGMMGLLCPPPVALELAVALDPPLRLLLTLGLRLNPTLAPATASKLAPDSEGAGERENSPDRREVGRAGWAVTSWTWRFRGLVVLDGGGRTTTNTSGAEEGQG